MLWVDDGQYPGHRIADKSWEVSLMAETVETEVQKGASGTYILQM